jgi:hypothetical protein
MMTGGMASINMVNIGRTRIKAWDDPCQEDNPPKGTADADRSHRKDSIMAHTDAVGSKV